MLILIRYGEIALKSKPVRKRFESQLARNIRAMLHSDKVEAAISADYGRFFLETQDKKALDSLKRVFGIVSFSICTKTRPEMASIEKEAVGIASAWKKGIKFRIKATRVGSHAFSSQDIGNQIGEAVRLLGFKVDLSNPDKTIYIEVRDKSAYVYSEKIPGPGGIPIGTEGSVASVITSRKGLLSTWMAMKRGCFVTPVFSKTSARLLPLLKKWDPQISEDFVSAKPMEKALEIAKAEGIGSIVTEETLSGIGKFQKPGVLVLRPLEGFNGKEILAALKKIS